MNRPPPSRRTAGVFGGGVGGGNVKGVGNVGNVGDGVGVGGRVGVGVDVGGVGVGFGVGGHVGVVVGGVGVDDGGDGGDVFVKRGHHPARSPFVRWARRRRGRERSGRF